MVKTQSKGDLEGDQQGRCMSCKETVTFTPTSAVVWKNGTEAVQGECPKGHKVFRIVGKVKK